MRWLGGSMVTMLVAAGSALAAPTPAAAPVGVEGGACGVDAACVPGLVCVVGRCELGGPCSATVTYAVNGREHTSRVGYSYDVDGQQMSRVETGAREVREETTVDRLRHTRTRTVWEGVPRDAAPTRVEEADDDVAGRANAVTVTDRTGDRVRRWLVTYLGPRTCEPRSSTTRSLPDGRLIDRTEVRCGDDGRPRESVVFEIGEGGAERQAAVETWRYDGAGRFIGVDGLAGDGASGRRWSWRYLREPSGRIVGLERDADGDGQAEVKEVWDLGCWNKTPGAVLLEHAGTD